MSKTSFGKIASFIEQIPGLIIVNMEGIVIFVNDQCAEYFQIEKKNILHRHIKEVFPATKMLENIDITEPTLVFYNTDLGIGISMHVPLYEEGRQVGLMEYDMVQASKLLYELSDEYNQFLNQELMNLTSELMNLGGTKYTIDNLIGETPAMIELKRKIISAAKTSSTVMIRGETGTGKELVAHAVHNLSSRRKERFIKVNSASIPVNLVESELFGYEAGAFTGANRSGKKGKFELADKGTLFIDEINQMPLSVQPKLLRVLQEKEIDRVGGEKPIPVDVRIIAASNEDLEEKVKEGTFREDLYYRLNVIELKTLPLRERIDDIEMLTQSIIEELNVQLGLAVTEIDRDALAALKKRRWQGNVRELKNVLERAMNFASGHVLHLEDFDFSSNGRAIDFDELPEKKGDRLIDQARNDAEREVIIRVLEHFDNNKSKAAEYLHIARPLLYQKMKRLNIK